MVAELPGWINDTRARPRALSRRALLVALTAVWALAGAPWSPGPPRTSHLAAQEVGRVPEEEEPGPDADDIDVTLPEVVVTATRGEAGTDRLPYSTRVIDEDDLRTRLAPRSLPDALEELPGVHVQKTAPGLESPFLRGFTGFRTLLLIDGIRLNNAVFRDGPNQYWGTVDPLAVARIEAVMGPSSVLYGSDAIGGTVNALTLDEFDDGIHPGLYYRFASAERAHTARADFRGREGPVGFTGGVSFRDFGDIDAGRHVGEQENTGYQALSGDAKVRWDVSRTLALTFAHQSFDQDDVPRTHSTADSISWRGTSPGNNRKRDFDQERSLSYVRAEWTPELDWLESATVTLSHHLQREREGRVRSSGGSTRQGFTDDTVGFSFSALSPSAIGDWTWGADYYIDTVQSFRTDRNPDGSLDTQFPRGPVADDALYGQLGVFVQDRIAPADWIEIIVGGRYNFVHADADSEDIDPRQGDSQTFDDLSETWHAAVGSGRVIFHPLEWVSPYVGVSQGFRAPNLSDLTRFDVAQSGVVERPNTDLDPELFVTYEGGAHFRGDRWRVTGAYYYTQVRDLIVRFETGTIIDGLNEVEKDNVGDGYVQGVDLDAEWEFLSVRDAGRFTALGSFSFVEGRVEQIDDTGDRDTAPISKGPPTSIAVGLRWNHPTRDIAVEATYRYVFKQDKLSFDDRNDTQRIPPGGTPGYSLLGIRGHWRISEAVVLFAGVENITNEDYRVHGSGSNGPGTSFVAGLNARW